jgi:chromosome segregation ATPase
MLNLEQVRALEARVEKAVILVTRLRQENADLERRLADAARAEDLLKNQNADLERQLAAQSRSVNENASRLESLLNRVKEAEEIAAKAELRAAESEERAAAMERKAQAADDETAHYRERALTAERRVAELESKSEELKAEQERIEQGLVQALTKLDSFEDMVLEMSLGTHAETQMQENSASSEQASLGQQAREVQEEFESDQGGGTFQEPEEDTSPDSGPQHAPFRGGENELDIF